MTLSTGTRLGPYEILSPLGAGGMGEVYKARDTRLDRTVAVKVLPEHLSSDPERRQRFEREARAVSSLNHPHICVLHDIGHQDGIDYIVMECLEGDSLADRIGKGPLPLDQALRCGIEIADALDKAHRQGVVHRDLKPANIMLSKSGAKLLDFGLAKTHAPAFGGTGTGSVVATQTIERALTGEGTLLGTLQYMAPEQLEGKGVDARTDIFSFGSVLYEMVTGKKAFEGKSSASLIAAILTSEPAPISSLQPVSPPALDRLVRTCLAKDPDERWQSAHDVESKLEWILEGGSQVAVPPAAAVKGIRARWRGALAWGVTSLSLAAISGIAIWNLKPTPPRPVPVSRFVVELAAGQALAGLDTGPAVAISSDATHLAYVAREGGTQQLYLRAMESLETKPIPARLQPLLLARQPMAGVLRGRKTEEGPGERRSGADPLHCWCDASRSQLGRPGADRLRTRSIWSSPASVGRGRCAAAADAPRERGGQPSLAAVLARRPGRAFRCRGDYR